VPIFVYPVLIGKGEGAAHLEGRKGKKPVVAYRAVLKFRKKKKGKRCSLDDGHCKKKRPGLV